MKENKEFIPEFLYNEESDIPFYVVPPGIKPPSKIFAWEFVETGEYEPGSEGEEVPMFDTDLALFFSYKEAKKVLSPELLDELRVAFGLDKLEDAQRKGSAIIDKVVGKVAAVEQPQSELKGN